MAEQVAGNPKSPLRTQSTEDKKIENTLDELIDKRKRFALKFNDFGEGSAEAQHFKQKYKTKSIEIGTCIQENFLMLREMDSLHVLKRCVEDKSLWIEVEPRLKAAADLNYDGRAVMDSILKHKENPWHLTLHPIAVGVEAHKDMKKFIQDACKFGVTQSEVHLQRICELCGYKKTMRFIEADTILGRLGKFTDPKPFFVSVDEQLDVPTTIQEQRKLEKESDKVDRFFRPDFVFGYLDKVYVYDWKFWTTKKGSPKKPYDDKCRTKMKEDMECLKHLHPDKEVIGHLAIFPKFDIDAAVHFVFVSQELD